ncbi:uncharacterized protein K452DRAFT_258728 [Aplosporella prunicola CBS 121167]|uniref:Heterokaryon incompatibility domain-containing protein n=1 Tax=Aplosporella prunicola CBS 121167 TaxID=1176127 RepID=A0A6A6B0C2_9PEZI|nr:uncharacterized protein K452DRAFT_258728 [Aplosporella prunicola CBS 121167]KAF2136675.1 hypothetical protein K452DRAFT_258728 [Aplosporella prunicola CBS 121167]
MITADASHMPPQSLQYNPMKLRRAALDPRQGVCLFIGDSILGNDISMTYFYRVPGSWCTLPPAQLEKMNDELQVMRMWLYDCLHNHSDCKRNEQSQTPARLLDLKAFGPSTDIKLVETSREQDCSTYVALSHCWGYPSKQPIRTTLETLAQRKERIDYEKLSKTFQDAVTTTRDLGERYLWIDSLCIIQDDAQDWEREASNMPAVYGGSLCTLAALSSQDGSEGCRVNGGNNSTKKRLRYVDVALKDRVIRFFENKPRQWRKEYGDNPYHHGKFGDNPLRGRAWTLQERELSQRSIHFSRNMLLWECATTKGTMELPWQEIEIQSTDNPSPWPIRNDLSETAADDGAEVGRDGWYSTVEEYSSRFLTKETDKLPALSGLAFKYSRNHDPGQYSAGIWTRHMPGALLWKTRPRHSPTDVKTRLYAAFHPRRPMSYRAPSWAWTPLDAIVSYESQRLGAQGSRPELDRAECDFGSFKVLDLRTELAANDPFGSIASAELQVEGCIAPARFSFEAPDGCKAPDNPDDGWGWILGRDGSAAGIFYPDISTEMQFLDEIFCVSCRGEPEWPDERLIPSELQELVFKWLSPDTKHDLVMGLALLPELNSVCTYRRVGLIRWVKRSLFADVQPTRVTLI